MKSLREKVMKILPEVEKPARYTGGEWNTVSKDLSQVKIKFALAFPEVYEVGMSHLGSRILYGLLNEIEDTAVERVYAPWPDMEEKMRSFGIPLFSLESFQPVKDFDFLGFTFQYELTFTNILNMLDLAGIPLKSEERKTGDPFVIAGGPSAFNPETMSLFIDFFVLGDGEEVILEIMQTYREWLSEGCSDRESFLKKAASIQGVYVPSFYRDFYNEQGEFIKLEPVIQEVPPVVKKRLVKNLNQAYYPKSWIVPYLKIVHDRVMLEIFRGCTRGCRFCQAGILYRPVRERTPEKLKKLAGEIIDRTGYEEISLTSLSSADYSNIQSLILTLQEHFEQEGINISLPSLRVDSFSVGLAKKFKRQKKSGLTFAPEAGTQRLRDVINKNISDEDLFTAVKEAFQAGWNQIKLYFMIGLPTERDEDLDGIINLAYRVLEIFKEAVEDKKRRNRLKVTVSASTFVPKPHTPFQWEPQISLEEIKRKQNYLRERLRGKNLTFDWHEPRASFLEAALSRGDRRISEVIFKAWELGCKFDGWGEKLNFEKWQKAFSLTGLQPEKYANQKLNLGSNLPWDHISTGVTKKFLITEYQYSREGIITVDCRDQRCIDCGVCSLTGIKKPEEGI